MMLRLLASLLACLALLPAAASAGPPEKDLRVAVLYFENQGNPDLDMLRLGLAQMLIADLAGTPGLKVVERTRLNEVLGELDLQKTDKVDPTSAAQLGRVLGVERLVFGHYFYFEPVDSLVVGARVVDVETGEILGAEQAQGSRQEFFALEKQIAGRLIPHLVPAKDAPPPEAEDKKEAPSGPGETDTIRGGSPRRGEAGSGRGREPVAASEAQGAESVESVRDDASNDPLGAALAFSEGLDHLDRKDLRRAQEALRRAVALDPDLDDARQALASIKL